MRRFYLSDLYGDLNKFQVFLIADFVLFFMALSLYLPFHVDVTGNLTGVFSGPLAELAVCL